MVVVIVVDRIHSITHSLTFSLWGNLHVDKRILFYVFVHISNFSLVERMQANYPSQLPCDLPMCSMVKATRVLCFGQVDKRE